MRLVAVVIAICLGILALACGSGPPGGWEDFCYSVDYDHPEYTKGNWHYATDVEPVITENSVVLRDVWATGSWPGDKWEYRTQVILLGDSEGDVRISWRCPLGEER